MDGTMNTTAEQIKERGEELRENAADMAARARQATQEKVLELKRQTEKQARYVGEQIQEHPLNSVLIAAGVGFMLGFLFRR